MTTSATATSTTIPVGTWALDPVHSNLTFKVKHMGISFSRGSFTEFAAELNHNENGTFDISGQTPVESISYANEHLIGHLMSPEFFDQQLHPTLSFKAQGFALNADKTVTVNGELTAKGVTKPITLTGTWSGPETGMANDTRLGISLEGSINRFDYDISWAAQLGSGADVVAKTVYLSAEMQFVLA